MTSEIRTNSLKSRAGMSTVTMTDTGPMFSGITTFVDNSGFTFGVGGGTSIFTPATNVLTFGTNNTEKIRIDANGNANITGVTTAANFKTGVSNLHDVGLTLSGGQLDVGSNIKIGNAGVVTATSFSGSGASLTNLNASNIASGTVPTARLGSGTANSSTFLAGDSTFKALTVPGGGTGLDFNDNVYLTWGGGDFRFFHSGTHNYIRGNGSASLYIQNSASEEAIRCTSGGTTMLMHGGSVKFQTTNTGANVTGSLEVADTDEYQLILKDNNNAGQGAEMAMGFKDSANTIQGYVGFNRWEDDDFHIGNQNSGGHITFKTHNGSAAGERVRIDSSGNVMIGRTDGVKKFSVKESSTSSGVHIAQTIGGSSHVSGYAVGLGFDPEGYSQRNKIAIVAEGTGNGYSRGKLHFLLDNNNNSSEVALNNSRMFITDDGQIGMGAPSSYSDPYRLYLRYYYSGGAGYANGLVIDSRPDVLSTKHIRFYYASHGSGGGSELGSVTSNNAGSVSYNTSSDYRRKKNDVAITDGIVKVKSLRPIRFNWIEQPEITEEGFFAHEAQEVVPNSVFGEKDALDNDGKPDYQVMDHSKLVPLLTASIQELIAKVEKLEEDNIALRTRVTTLEGN